MTETALKHYITHQILINYHPNINKLVCDKFPVQQIPKFALATNFRYDNFWERQFFDFFFDFSPRFRQFSDEKNSQEKIFFHFEQNAGYGPQFSGKTIFIILLSLFKWFNFIEFQK